MAAALRTRTGFNGTALKFIKGKWCLGRDEVGIPASAQFIARPDWSMHGWSRWRDRRLVDFRIGFIADDFKPPARHELGDTDREQWAIWSDNRDPWVLQWHLPLFGMVSGEAFVWSTDTVGGKQALADLLSAYADQADSGELKNLPVVELRSSSYPHQDYGRVHTPQFDIVGWAEPPATARPALPVAAPAALPDTKTISAPRASIEQDMDDEIPF
jgi:hypothetical protein